MSSSAHASLVLVLAAFGGTALVACDANVTATTTTIKPEILELVNVIKQDLRANNDDYAEHRPRLGVPRSAYLNLTMRPAAATTRATTRAPARATTRATTRAPAPASQQLPFNHLFKPEDTRRRYNPMQGQDKRQLMNNILERAGLSGQIRQKPDPKKLKALAEKLKHQSSIKNDYPKKYSNKEDKLKMFIKKNAGKLQQFVNQQQQQVQQAQMKARVTESSSSSSESATESLAFKLPAGDELDMAPAQGARIHAMRLKGRLCFRNVMYPEGPKYDSKGKIYLPAHGEDRKRRRKYDQTAMPRHVLPKCCNCCMKSVLGCE